MTDEIIKLDLKSFQDMCKTIEEQKNELEFLQRQNNALKIRCSDYSLRISKLESEIADMKFTREYLTSEEAGRQFAKELLSLGGK